VSDFPLRDLHRAVFLELSRPSRFVGKDELTGWLAGAGCRDIHVEPHSGYAWRARATAHPRPALVAARR
jgi:hypothetical protein